MKVLLILADGMRPDALADVPAAQEIMARARVCLQARTVMPSVTLPCHMSLFHSVDPARHGTTTNTYMPQVRPIRGLCEVLRAAGRRCAMFYDWEELRDVARPDSLLRSCFYSGHQLGYAAADPMLEQEAVSCIRSGEADFIFLYIGNPDEMGHRFGWMSPAYREAVRSAWEEIDRVLKTEGMEEYAVFITADHGGHERMHGYDVPEDMTIPLLLLWDGDTSPLPADADIKDIAPTVAELLGAAPDPEWEGRSLL